MGLLISKIWSFMGNEEHKLVLVGLDNAGKTTILYQLLLGEAVHTRPTIGSNVEEVVWRNLRFVMWDLGGQQSLRSAWNTYYTNSEFVIMVIDSTDRERLAISREELHRMLRHEELSRACLLVFANKQDVKGCMTAAEISRELDLTSIKHHPWHIQACCALTGEGLYLGMEWIRISFPEIWKREIPESQKREIPETRGREIPETREREIPGNRVVTPVPNPENVSCNLI